MDIETVALAALRAPERNVRAHPEGQITELMRAVEMFGQTRPVVIDEDGVVLAGNGLVTALQRLGRDTAQVLRVSGLSRTAKHKLMLSDNKIFSLGHDDYDGIMSLIRGLDDLDIPGFDGDLLSSLIASDITATQSLDAFGQMTADEKTQRANQPVVQAQHTGGKTTVVCPHCGKDFVVQ